MKDYPTYTSVKYYYTDKTVSDKWEYRDWKHDKETGICGTLIVTEDGCYWKCNVFKRTMAISHRGYENISEGCQNRHYYQG